MNMKKLITLLILVLAPGFASCSTFKKGIKSDVAEQIDPAGQESYTILVYGDFGEGDKPGTPTYRVGDAMTYTCRVLRCDFALGLGDNFYSSGVKSVRDMQFQTKFEIPYRDMNFPHFQTLGNHDYAGNAKAQIQYTSVKWRMPGAYYPVPNLPEWLTIFALDTEKLSDSQLSQAERVLCGKSGQKIVFGHHPAYSNGGHGDTSKIKAKVLPMLRECGVKWILSGHDHHLEHISTPDIEQVISGSAGKLRAVKIKQRAGIQQRFAVSAYGFAVMTVKRDSVALKFYDEKGAQIYAYEKPQTQ